MNTKYLPTSPEGKKDRVLEEIGEVIQAIGKCGRWGMIAKDPYTGIEYDNRATLRAELADLKDAIDRFDSSLADVDTYSPEELAWHQERNQR